MSRYHSMIGIILSLSLLSATVVAEEATTCRKCSMKMSEAGKKFSVIMPKIPGMEGSTFDDVGCAVVWRNNECASRQINFDSNALTYDYGTGEQLAMENAFFVVGAGISTPAGYDIIAFREKAAAEKFVTDRKKGQVLKLFQLMNLPIK